MKKLMISSLSILLLFACTQKEEVRPSFESQSTHEMMNDIVDRLLAGNYDDQQIRQELDILEEKALVEEKHAASLPAADSRAMVCNNQLLRGKVSVRTGSSRTNTAGFNVQITSTSGNTFVNTVTSTESPYNYCNSSSMNGNNLVCMTLSDSDGTYEYSDWVNGITVSDMVLLARHVLRYNTFTYGEQLLAGNVNRDADLDLTDVDEMRDLILARISEIDNISIHSGIASQGNRPWLFASELSMDEETYILQNFPELLDFQEGLITGQGLPCFTSLYAGGPTYTPASRVAVKLGDVNFTANLNGLAD